MRDAVDPTLRPMRTLYHFAASPFARRTRLGLMHKGLECELRDARENAAWLDEVRQLVPFKTLPVLVDSGRALGDSTAITRWLDAAYPDAPRIWPEGDDAFSVLETTALVDVALGAIIDVGTRYYALREDAAWAAVRDEILGRAQRALDALGQRVEGLDRPTIAKSGWSAADMWIVTAVAWLGGLPGRIASSPNAAQIMTVGGWRLPQSLAHWAKAHTTRADVRAL
jgi:glutathione S-transferase